MFFTFGDMHNKQKYWTLSFMNNVKIIVEIGLRVKRKKDIAFEFKIPANSSTIIKNKENLHDTLKDSSVWLDLGGIKSRLWKSLVQWLKCAKDILVSEWIQRAKTETFATEVGSKELKSIQKWESSSTKYS